MINVEKVVTDPRFIKFGTLDLGSTVGPIELIKEDSKKEIKADQRGPNAIAEIFTGTTYKVKCELQEVDVALLKELWNGITTEAHTPTTGSEVIGFGTSKIGTNMATVAKTLTLENLDGVTNADTIHFWKAYPNTEGLKLSGEENKTVTVEFVIVEDITKVDSCSYGVMGDYNQDFAKV